LLPEKRYYELVQQISNAVIDIGANLDVGAIRVIGLLISSTRKRNVLGQAAIYGVIRDKLREERFPERAFAMFVISENKGYPYAYGSYLDANVPSWQIAISAGSYFSQLRNEFRTFNYERAESDAAEARIYQCAYQERYSTLFHKFGFASLYSSGPEIVFR